jgi:transcription initiation factor TFIIIB Brf1 subunit/transcription initiation factor TFIIB
MPNLSDSITRMLDIISNEIDVKHKIEIRNKLRPIISKLQDRVNVDHRSSVANPEKMNATLIFMACKFAKIRMTLKKIAILFSTSEPTILKLEKVVQDILITSS